MLMRISSRIIVPTVLLALVVLFVRIVMINSINTSINNITNTINMSNKTNIKLLVRKNTIQQKHNNIKNHVH